ncbi:hypothetical protein HEK616_39100 [Streptomyces nigrescens]|uniref:Uncharacterized protein n=1 Tax=Streptomyces nigrescens TaxID=1920 RepID=A0ABM7ZVQ9_STRNI|nr:hypothetical protein HEK616_39100 [Streptomyces nigrescens]
MAMVTAVPVPRLAKESGTITKSDEAGVRQESVSRVPPTTPMDRVSLGAAAVPSAALRVSRSDAAGATGV